MFKKIGILTLAGAACVALLTWSGMGSYASTAYSKLKGNFKKQVPLEFEIERLKHEVTQLIPETRKNFRIIAEESVAVDNLRDEIVFTKTNLKQQKENLKIMTTQLEAGTETIVLADRTYDRDRISEKLSRDFTSYKRCEAELKAKEQLLKAKERALEAARQQLGDLGKQKRELEVQIAQLEADLKTVRLAQTRNKYHFDDGQLAKCKATVAEIRDRLNVEITVNELEGQFTGDPIPVEPKAKPVSEVTREIKAYFGDAKDEGKLATSKK